MALAPNNFPWRSRAGSLLRSRWSGAAGRSAPRLATTTAAPPPSFSMGWALIACLGMHATSSSAGRPAVLTCSPWTRLLGGQASPPLILRLRSKDGTKRITTPGDHTRLSELQELIRSQLHIPPSRQLISLQPGGEPLDLSSDQTLSGLGLVHGSTLHLARDVGVDAASANGPRRAPSAARRVTVDVTAKMSERQANKVVIAAAPAAACEFVSIDASAWDNFAGYLVDTEMELMRVALLFGHIAEGNGVQVSDTATARAAPLYTALRGRLAPAPSPSLARRRSMSSTSLRRKRRPRALRSLRPRRPWRSGSVPPRSPEPLAPSRPSPSVSPQCRGPSN